VDRRVFVAASLALLAAPLVAAAQQSGRVARIGILGNVPLTDPEGARLWGAFVEGLRELGYVDGQNIAIEHRSSEGHYERLPQLAADLVRLKVDVIVAPATQGPLAAKQATRTIPIIMTGAGDPVGSGVVASLAHPAGNVTGVSTLSREIVGKQLELLKESVPNVSRVAILWNPTNPTYVLAEVKVAARLLGVQLHTLEAREPAELDGAFATMTKERASALLVPVDGMFILHQKKIIDLVARSRVPAMFGLREQVSAGGLMAYGASLRESFHRGAAYVDKILRGAKPADLPIEQPTKFEFVINLKTAKALGIKISDRILSVADQVID